MGFLLFVFFLLVFIAMLVGGSVVKRIRKFKKNAEQAADKREQQFREEVGRQPQQYSQRQQAKTAQGAQEAQRQRSSQNPQDAQDSKSSQQSSQQEEARHTQTATGETIIDHHHKKRENKKIFDDVDGEYVEFEEA